MNSDNPAREVAPAQRRIAIAIIVASLLAIAFLTLRPESGRAESSFWCLRCGDRAAIDVILNVFLFVPLGVGLALYGLPFQRAVLLALACTCLVETLQFWIPGRDASARDILANSIGGVIGHLLGRDWRVLAVPDRSAARVVAAAAIGVWLAMQGLTALALQLAPPPEPWWAQLRPDRDNFPSFFTGRVLDFSLGRFHMPENDQIAADTVAEMRREMFAGEPLRVRITNVDTAKRLAAIAIISAGPVHDVAWWASDQRGAVYGVIVRGSLLGLRTPTVRIPAAVSLGKNDTVELAGSYHKGIYTLQAHDRSGTRRRMLRASPSMTWALLVPIPLYAFGEEVLWLTALYLFVMWCVLGYWCARSEVIALVVLGIFFGLCAIPILFRLPVAHWSEWLACIAGAATGWLLAKKSEHRRHSFAAS